MKGESTVDIVYVDMLSYDLIQYSDILKII